MWDDVRDELYPKIIISQALRLSGPLGECVVCEEQCCCSQAASVRRAVDPDDKGPHIHPQAWRTIAVWGLVAVSAAWLSLVCVDVWSSSDRWLGHTAISVTFPSDVQYVLFPADDHRETAAVHPSPHTALRGTRSSSAAQSKFSKKISIEKKIMFGVKSYLAVAKPHIIGKNRGKMWAYLWQIRVFYL